MDVRIACAMVFAVFVLTGCSWNRMYRGNYPEWPWSSHVITAEESVAKVNGSLGSRKALTQSRGAQRGVSANGGIPSPAVICLEAACKEGDVQTAWNDATMYCLAYHQDYGKAANHQDAAKTLAKTLGIVSGTVLQTVTTGSASKAWGSVAGATNAFGEHLNGMLLNAVSVNQQATIEKVIDKWEVKYLASLKEDKSAHGHRVWLAMGMARECATSSARAEQEVLKAIGNVSPAASNVSSGAKP